MHSRSPYSWLTSFLFLLLPLAGIAPAQQLSIVNRPPDPHGSPRPARDAVGVPVRTSLYFEIKLNRGSEGDGILPESVSVRIAPEGGQEQEILGIGRKFADGYSGWLRSRAGRGGSDYQNVSSLAVYLDSSTPLRANQRYTVRVTAETKQGAKLPERAGTWSFTTASGESTQPVQLQADLNAQPVEWEGQFFSGLCHILFCTNASGFEGTNELLAEAREKHPGAWSYQRDFWMTGMDRAGGIFESTLPNIVRERETRRIRKMETGAEGIELQVEDFFGHQQYGIESNRPLSEDYHPGDVVLIADPESDVQATVISVDDAQRTVLVSSFETPAAGWKLEYIGALPAKEDPDAPGLFAHGGCYLTKLNPHGTACYYWGRLDKEFDLEHKKYGRRLLANFADAPGDLARHGHNFDPPKDFAQYHEVVRTIAGHLIDRYGRDSLTFTWSVFNEPDLGALFWHGDWNELQTFYDYTTDGILRAFEDRGYDSSQVFVGGLELGAVFGTNLRLTEFLAHCSPTATARGALEKNAAFADKRLDGKRSRLVEELCGSHQGQGSPCRFLSIHAYNSAETMSDKLTRAKEMALKTDPEYFKELWINSHECCPEWSLPPDQAASDSYLGNGYAETWAVDFASRQLQKAGQDSRYGYGETLFTVWPPSGNFGGANAVTRIIDVDDNGDGRRDRQVTVASPLLHALTLLADFGERYWNLPLQVVDGRRVSGFATRTDDGTLRVMLFAHQGEDTQSRSDTTFRISLDLQNTGLTGDVRVRETRIDKEHNSYFQEALKLRDPSPSSPEEAREIKADMEDLRSNEVQKQLAAIDRLQKRNPRLVQKIGRDLMRMSGGRDELNKLDETVRKRLGELMFGLRQGQVYSPEEISDVLQRSKLTATSESNQKVQADGRLSLSVDVSSNGLNYLEIAPGQ